MKNNRTNIALFCFAIVFFWFSLYTYVPILSVYAGTLGATEQLIGVILGTYGFFQMIIRIPIGVLSDRLHNRKLFVLLGFAFSLLAAAGMYFFRSSGALLVFRSIAGLAAGSWVAFTVLYSGYFDDANTSRAIGHVNALNNLGQMAGIFFGGIVAQKYGYEATFLFAVIVGLIGLAFGAFSADSKSGDKPPMTFRALFATAANAGLLIASGLAILNQMVTFSTVYGFTPKIAKEMLGATSFDLGLLTAFTTIPAIIASYFSGSFVLKRFGLRASLTAAFLVTALSTAAIPLTPNLPLLFLTQVIGGFGRGIIMSLLMNASISRMEPAKRATAMGFYQAIYGAGMLLGPVIVGAFGATSGGLSWGMYAMAGVAAAGSLLSFLLISGRSRAAGA